ncbi:sigma-54-dependent transcriptional regulator [Magnetococcus sp. PR-3]|uniref:sigma-54-dependent transcriptional regulator n=1 Tax=Magnetococcus sp. PR-3 TaxID=3120355 RepID=UPI002FCE556B
MSEDMPVMLIDDDRHIRLAATQALELAGFEVESFEAAEPALAQLDKRSYAAVISDIRMAGMDGLTFMNQALAAHADLPVILITGHGDVSVAVQAMRDGAFDFIEKPFSSEHLVEVTTRAAEKSRLERELHTLKRALAAQNAPGSRLIGRATNMQGLRKKIRSIAETDVDVLVLGETGSGKEVVARTIHEHSLRRDGPFVAVNCGAIPESMIENELFGHEAGAFTGATNKRVGKLEHANDGTLFLDEIESMPLSFQVKILRVLQERTLERLGSNTPVALNIRIVAATKVDLREAADRKEFREDLYYRLNVAMLTIPPLRERREDLPLLFEHFLLQTAARYQRDVSLPAPEHMTKLMSHSWPGNVRELANCAERYVLFGETGYEDQQGDEAGAPCMGADGLSLPQQVALFEKTMIAQELSRHKGDIKATLDGLQVPRKTLYDKMRKYSLDRANFV